MLQRLDLREVAVDYLGKVRVLDTGCSRLDSVEDAGNLVDKGVIPLVVGGVKFIQDFPI